MISRNTARGLAVLAAAAFATTVAGCGSGQTADTPGSATPTASATAEASIKNTSVVLTNNTGAPVTINWSTGIGNVTAGTVTVANGSSTSSTSSGLSDAEAAVAIFTTADGTLVGLAVSNPAIGYPNVRTCPDKSNGAPAGYTCTSENDFSPLSSFSENEEKTLYLENYNEQKLITVTAKRGSDTSTNKNWTITLT